MVEVGAAAFEKSLVGEVGVWGSESNPGRGFNEATLLQKTRSDMGQRQDCFY